MAGQAIEDAKNTAAGAEEMLDRELDFAYHDKLGYLSPNIYECGSGLEFSSALFLPSIKDSNSYEMIRSELSLRGMSIFPLFNTNPDTSGIYALKYSPSHLANEDTSCAFFSHAVEKLIQFEKQNQSIIYVDRGKIILDNACRALGALLYSHSISEKELLSLAADIRLARVFCSGESTSFLPSSADLNFLITEGLSNSILTSAGAQCASVEECNELRSKLIKQYIMSKKNTGIEVI
jgi:protein arginine kinase